MSTQLTTSAVLRRVAARSGAGLWRQRGGVLVALALVAGITGYMALGVTGESPLALGATSTATAGGDCADTAIAAIANKSGSSAQSAYQCMDPSFQQRVPEQTFVQQLQAQELPNVNNISRVGDYRSQTGSTMVYYAIDANGQSIGYIVYLGQDGKVTRIE
jgi:hypothetical protein